MFGDEVGMGVENLKDGHNGYPLAQFGNAGPEQYSSWLEEKRKLKAREKLL